MSWIVIALIVLLAAFGPVMWLRPSARDKRLTALRARARELGLNVDVRPLEQLNPSAAQRVSAGGAKRDTTVLLAVYESFLERRLRHIEPFRIFRAPAGNEAPMTRAAVEVAPGWVFDPDAAYPASQHWLATLAVLAPALEELPGDVAALALGPRSLAVYWRETAGSSVETVDDLARLLGRIGAAIGQLDTTFAPASGDDVP
ncbi:MAG: hypothetical protein AAGI15_04965 [Pseudomonadota bacterium]